MSASAGPSSEHVAQPAGREAVVLGLLRMAGLDVALPLSALREVIPAPPRLSDLPAQAPGLVGAVGLRRLVLPVMDLAVLLGRPASDPSAARVVVVVTHQGRVLGLLADAVRGICRIEADAHVAFRSEGGDLLFSSSFRHPETGDPCSVLDAAAIMGHPGVLSVSDSARAGSEVVSEAGSEVGSAAGSATPAGSSRTMTLLRCGGHRFAIDARDIHTTVPLTEVRSSVLVDRLCRGVVDFSGHQLPVVDPLALLGLGELADDEVGAGVVLDLGVGRVVLALSELLELTQVDARDVLDVPAFAFARPELLVGTMDSPAHGDCLVLDGGALRADRQLLAFAAVNTVVREAEPPPGDRARLAAAAATGAPSYLALSVGIDIATPLEHVVEILARPRELTMTHVEGVLGVLTHRAASVPVLCLASLLGVPQPPADSDCLLLVDVDGALVAFAVASLRTIAPRTWSDGDQAVRGPAADRGATLRSAPLVRIGEDAGLLPDVDLLAVARRFVQRRTPALPAPRSAVEGQLVD